MKSGKQIQLAFNWHGPKNSWNKIASLPIYLGQAMHYGCGVHFPIDTFYKNSMGKAILDFIDSSLKNNNISYIVAIDEPSGWVAKHYFGEWQWDQEDNKQSFFQHTNIKGVKYFSFEHGGSVVTLISKRQGSLYHWQVFKGCELYYEAHILSHVAHDGDPIKLHENKNNAQIVYDMTYETLTDPSLCMYNHCAVGIGRSAQVTFAQLFLINQHEHLRQYKLVELPDSEEKEYPENLLKWMHSHRSGLLPGCKSGANEQLHDAVKTGKYFLTLKPSPVKVNARVNLMKAETDVILQAAFTEHHQLLIDFIAAVKKGTSFFYGSIVFSIFRTQGKEKSFDEMMLQLKQNSPKEIICHKQIVQKVIFNALAVRGDKPLDTETTSGKAIVDILKKEEFAVIRELLQKVVKKKKGEDICYADLRAFIALPGKNKAASLAENNTQVSASRYYTSVLRG